MHVGITSVLRRYCVGALAVALASPAFAQDAPWHGAWAGDVAWCDKVDRIGSVTPAPVRLTAEEFLGYENTCAITRTQDVGLNAWMIDMTCQAEGDVFEEQRLLMADGETLWIWFGNGAPIDYTRCHE